MNVEVSVCISVCNHSLLEQGVGSVSLWVTFRMAGFRWGRSVSRPLYAGPLVVALVSTLYDAISWALSTHSPLPGIARYSLSRCGQVKNI